MKRGFTQTLMMVAIVIMAAQAMAMAPVILDIPSPVVGDKDSVTPPNTFVYPDAIDLSQYVDGKDTTDTTQLSWFYESSNHHYKINNSDEVTAADIASANAIASIAPGKFMAGLGNVNRDTSGTQTAGSSLITIRNEFLSPIADHATGAGYKAPVNADAETELVTFYCSDGETVSLPKSIYFYTHKGEEDHLSPGGINQKFHDFTNNANGYTYALDGGNASHAVTANGLCWGITLAETQDTIARYTSPNSEIALVKNNVYRIRMVVNGTQTTVNQVPLWDCVIANNNNLENYGADFFMYDTNGSENGYVQFVKGDTTFDFWWTPAPVKTKRWNDTTQANGKPGIWADSAAQDTRDGKISFRMICSKATGSNLHTNLAVGTMCLKSIAVDRYELDALKPAAGPALWQSKTSGFTASDFNYEYTDGKTTMTPGSDGLVMKATSGTGEGANCYASIVPGDANVGNATDVNNTAHIDDYPAVLEPKSLYKLTYMLAAPTQSDEDNPIDAIWLAATYFSLEEMQQSYTSGMGWYHGLPAYKEDNVVKPQPFILFFYSNYGTNNNKNSGYAETPAWWSCFHPKIAYTNNWGYIPAGTKTGSIKLSGITIEKIASGM